MAKLYCDIETNRTHRRRSEVHRLGDSWVEAGVQNWEYGLRVELRDDGMCFIHTRAVGSGNPSQLVYMGPLADLYQGGMKIAPRSIPTPPTVVKETALDRDVQQFLKESA